MTRVLLTGANGFIGRNIIEILSDDFEFIEITRDSTYEITNLESYLGIEDIDIVIHAGAKTFVPDSYKNPYDFYKFNINSTLDIAEFCRVKEVKKLIYLNSYPYGNPKYLPIDEMHPISFHSPYNKSKYIAEELLINYLEGVTNVISLRLFNIYGKYQNDIFLIPTILKQAIQRETIIVQNLLPKRDYIYIKDILNLIRNIIFSDNKQGIYNVGSGISHSVQDVIDIVNSILSNKSKIQSENIMRENEVMNCVANIEKVKLDFKWSPVYTLKAGLKDYIRSSKKC